MGSSPSKDNDGGEWKSEIYFDPEADSKTGKDYRISDSDLKSKLKELIKTEEKMLKIWVYCSPLYKLQLTQALFHHAFVVIETDSWYWSIEKNCQGITIQRSKNLSYVKLKYRRGDRGFLNFSVKMRAKGDGHYQMEELIDWLYRTDELNMGYDVTQRRKNCQGFAGRVFNYFARNEEYFAVI